MRIIFRNHVLRLPPTTESVLSKNKALSAAPKFEEFVTSRFASFMGKTASQIANELRVRTAITAKNFHADVTKAILNVSPEKEIEEFEKAEVLCRTIRIKPSGLPKEDVSFPNFDYFNLLNQEWETSDFRLILVRRFFFVIYKSVTSDDEPTLHKTAFWTMPAEDREVEARWVWEETRKRIREHRANHLPKKSENRVSHVRPHGRNKRDTLQVPGGGRETKKCFWINASYLRTQLRLS